MKPTMNDLHKAEQEIDKKLKEQKKCEHGTKAESCKKCKQEALRNYFVKGLESVNGKGR